MKLTVFLFHSEGSVIAYFMIAFNVGKTRLLEHRQSLLADDVIKVLRKTIDSNTAAVFLGNLLIDVNSIDIYGMNFFLLYQIREMMCYLS